LLRILEELGHRHPSFTEISEAVRSRYPSISQSTVLVNLNAMVELGLFDSFSYDGETRYELNPSPHVNLVDTSGSIVDIDNPEVQRLLARLLEIINSRGGVKANRLLVLAE
jgi:Fe2+ or Zn2+ uptake regulation protein